MVIRTALVAKTQKDIRAQPHLSGHLDIPGLVFGDEFLKLLDVFRGLRLNYREHFRSFDWQASSQEYALDIREGHMVSYPLFSGYLVKNSFPNRSAAQRPVLAANSERVYAAEQAPVGACVSLRESGNGSPGRNPIRASGLVSGWKWRGGPRRTPEGERPSRESARHAGPPLSWKTSGRTDIGSRRARRAESCIAPNMSPRTGSRLSWLTSE